MISYDVSPQIFDMVDTLLGDVIPLYQYQLKNMNVKVDFIWLDQYITQKLQMDMKNRWIWYPTLDEAMSKATELGMLSERDLEDFLIQFHLGVNLSDD